ncbi:hypothetical protein ONZ45_g15479 [Pleurotus djamor]|nr:hypothetical protein ONZ45_g15479 [Pleurotus djamor]
MSHSATTTAAHILVKYSKCHSHSGGSDQSTQPPEGPGEWQHFNNPTLRLILDTKKSLLTKELESVRLRIVWTIEAAGSQNEVIFEDLDLLSYSDINTPASHANGQAASNVPLKAVYREAVVGIRYLYPLAPNPNAQPKFQRFQVTFASASSALEFINSIRYVCPCRANPVAPAIERPLKSRPTQAQAPIQTFPASTPRPALRRTLPSFRFGQDLQHDATDTTMPQQTRGSGSAKPKTVIVESSRQALDATGDAGTGVIESNNDGDRYPPSSAPSRVDSSDDIRELPETTDSLGYVRWGTNSGRTSNERLSNPQMLRERQTDSRITKEIGRTSDSSANLPGSTPPSSGTSDSMAMPPPRLPLETTTEAPILRTVREYTRLCDLTSVELEDLVSRIVCEDDFPKLMQRLDSLWKVKALLDS